MSVIALRPFEQAGGVEPPAQKFTAGVPPWAAEVTTAGLDLRCYETTSAAEITARQLASRPQNEICPFPTIGGGGVAPAAEVELRQDEVLAEVAHLSGARRATGHVRTLRVLRADWTSVTEAG